MVTALTVLHYVVCIFLAAVVLLQQGKGADMGAGFGGSGQTLFGGRGATTFLHKLTAGAAFTFLLTSLSLAYLSSRESSKSLFAGKKAPAATASPTPAASPTASPTTTAVPSKATPGK